MPVTPVLLLLAGEAVAPPPPPPPPPYKPSRTSGYILDVTDKPPGNEIERNNVRWHEWLSHLPPEDPEQEFECGKPKVRCSPVELIVTNRHPVSLRCHGEVHFAQPNPQGIRDSERTLIVAPGKFMTVVRSAAPLGVKVTLYATDCVPEPPLPPLDNPPECKLKIIKPQVPDDYYTRKSRNALHEGPVFLEFTVGQESGPPTEIKVIQSSLFPDLDAAAIKAHKAQVMSTNCPGKRFRTSTTFRLK